MSWLAYPLQSEALLTIGVLAVLRLVLYIPLGFLLNVLVTVAMLRYAAAVLVSSADGETEAPNGIVTTPSLGWVVLRVQIALTILGGGGTFVLHYFFDAGWLALLPLLLISMATPAALMIAAIDESTMGALNPTRWIELIARIGPRYFQASFLCLAILVVEVGAQWFLAPWLPPVIGLVMVYFIAHYCTVLMFHLLGRLVYDRRDALGYQPDPVVRKVERPKDKDQAILDASEAPAKRGDFVAAAGLLAAHIEQRGGTDAVHSRYRQYLQRLNDTSALNDHSRSWLNVMIANERWAQALTFWNDVRTANPGVWPISGELLVQLLEKAHELGRPELCPLFASGFAQAHPGDAYIGRVHSLTAMAMLALGQTHEALALVESTLAAYPKSKARSELEALRHKAQSRT